MRVRRNDCGHGGRADLGDEPSPDRPLLRIFDTAQKARDGIAACEGSLLIVDASQGVAAHDLAKRPLGDREHHEIVPI